jgi:hypothetical protein
MRCTRDEHAIEVTGKSTAKVTKTPKAKTEIIDGIMSREKTIII